MELIVSKIDEKLGVVIPAGLLARHQLKPGDKLYCLIVAGGGRNTSSDTDFAETMEIVERIMREDHEVLRRLAE